MRMKEEWLCEDGQYIVERSERCSLLTWYVTSYIIYKLLSIKTSTL